MPAERVSMRKIRDVLRLTHALGMSRRLVGEAVSPTNFIYSLQFNDLGRLLPQIPAVWRDRADKEGTNSEPNWALESLHF